MGWILGWAVPETWFAELARAAAPEWEHVCHAASPDVVAQVTKAGAFDLIGGYSLGSHLLLAACPALPAVLLAPIFAFPQEAGTGGKVARAQIKHLARWLRREPRAALSDFFRRAGLDVVPPANITGGDLARLLWGLAQLENSFVSLALPVGWSAWCGADDPLIDSAWLHERVPAVKVVAGGSHHPAALLRAWAEKEGR